MDAEDLYRRFQVHPPTEASAKAREDVRVNAYAFACSLAKLPDSREKELAVERLEEAMFWAFACASREVG